MAESPFAWDSPVRRGLGTDIFANPSIKLGDVWAPPGGPIVMHPRDFLLLKIELDVKPYARKCAMREIVRSRHRRGLALPSFESLNARIR